MLRRALVIWLLLMVVAVANGAFRAGVLVPAYGDETAHHISVLMLCAIIALITRKSLSWMSPATARQASMIGGFWLALTVGFEFLAGHFLFGAPWPRLLADYNVLDGRIWMLVLLVTLLAPVWAFRARGDPRARTSGPMPPMRHVLR